MHAVLIAAAKLHGSLRHWLDDALAPEELSVAQWLILAELSRHAGGTLGTSARATKREAGPLSRVVHQLSLRRLLTNQRSRSDRRSARPVFTAAGQQLAQRIGERIDRLADSLGHTSATTSLRTIAPLLLALSRGIDRFGCVACRLWPPKPEALLPIA